MAKFISVEEAVSLIPEGATVMFGGFMGCGNAHRFISALSEKGAGGLTMICNDAAYAGGPMGEEYYGVAKLVHKRQVKTLIATHVGLNPEVAAQSMTDGTLEVQLLPQGSFVEMIRAGGSGLGGVLTPVGVGTLVEDSPFCLGKQRIGDQDYLLMAPIRADFTVISGYKIDKAGNIWYKGDTSNFSVAMATAADVVIAEAEQIVELGEIPPEDVRTPGILVDYVVEGGLYKVGKK